jgi:hypothetical protein
VQEATAAVELLKVFPEASGLHCNLSKSSASPIRCSEIDLQPVMEVLACELKSFPIQYLGLPLSTTHLAKVELQPLVDKIARGGPAWTAALLKKSGRLVYLNAKLAASPINHMLSLDLHSSPWFSCFGDFSGLQLLKPGRATVWWRGRRSVHWRIWVGLVLRTSAAESCPSHPLVVVGYHAGGQTMEGIGIWNCKGSRGTFPVVHQTGVRQWVEVSVLVGLMAQRH